MRGDVLMRLARRVFSYSDQERFATASGDRNPMHMDPLAARRTSAGAPVVHGIHLLLWALDSLATSRPSLPQLRSIRTQFNRFVYLDEVVDVVAVQQDPNRARLIISVGDAPRARVTLDFGAMASDVPGVLPLSPKPVPLTSDAMNPDFESMAELSGQLQFAMTSEDAEAMFPGANQWLGSGRIAALAASTYLVGMVCPGLHSIYSELSVKTCLEPVAQRSLSFRVTETDSRFPSVEQEIAGGGLTGTIRAFVRTPPVEQAAMNSLVHLVGQNEFAGSVALVVGGSRGLGELTAKLIATGGGRVIVTWYTGRTDAERVAQEIRTAGRECEILAYDARKPATEQLAMLAIAPTHAYYFATPPIFRPEPEIFVQKRLNEFLDIYVKGFWELSKALRVREPRVSLFYPSSVFVTERPLGMTEYAMAKAAGELLCTDVNEYLSPTHVTVSRLPRLPTDQTATVTEIDVADPIVAMLPIVREVQSWPK
jgi:acyl dehydratase